MWYAVHIAARSMTAQRATNSRGPTEAPAAAVVQTCQQHEHMKHLIASTIRHHVILKVSPTGLWPRNGSCHQRHDDWYTRRPHHLCASVYSSIA